MLNEVKRIDVEKAALDLKQRSLAALRCDLARLVYLASTRDYNTGRYYHEGLALRFTEEAAQRALENCHHELFRKLTLSSLEDLTQELCSFIDSTRFPMDRVLEAWQNLEPYRTVVPLSCDPVWARFFLSNIKLALAILGSRQAKSLQDPQSASLPQ